MQRGSQTPPGWRNREAPVEELRQQEAVGRGAGVRPPNRFEALRLVDEFDQVAHDELPPARRAVPTEYLIDQTRSIIAKNNSPDVPFTYSINPYRGCEHGCAYCYARPTHEHLGMDAGMDFETRILVKRDAAKLLRDELNRPSWRGETIAISGVTDCYQPAERKFQITRQCLEVMHEANQAVGIITKNCLVLRDLDLLTPLAARRLVHVYLSISTLDQELARKLEPRTATPAAKLKAIRQLTAAGVTVGVMVAPIIPGLTDEEIPSILKAAAAAGARTAGKVMLRLPLAVEPIFRDWLARHYPLKQARVEALIRSVRGGELSESQFGQRMTGSGSYAEQIAQTFEVFKKKYALDRGLPAYDHSKFRRVASSTGQMRLF